MLKCVYCNVRCERSAIAGITAHCLRLAQLIQFYRVCNEIFCSSHFITLTSLFRLTNRFRQFFQICVFSDQDSAELDSAKSSWSQEQKVHFLKTHLDNKKYLINIQYKIVYFRYINYSTVLYTRTYCTIQNTISKFEGCFVSFISKNQKKKTLSIFRDSTERYPGQRWVKSESYVLSQIWELYAESNLRANFYNNESQ